VVRSQFSIPFLIGRGPEAPEGLFKPRLGRGSAYGPWCVFNTRPKVNLTKRSSQSPRCCGRIFPFTFLAERGLGPRRGFLNPETMKFGLFQALLQGGRFAGNFGGKVRMVQKRTIARYIYILSARRPITLRIYHPPFTTPNSLSIPHSPCAPGSAVDWSEPDHANFLRFAKPVPRRSARKRVLAAIHRG